MADKHGVLLFLLSASGQGLLTFCQYMFEINGASYRVDILAMCVLRGRLNHEGLIRCDSTCQGYRYHYINELRGGDVYIGLDQRERDNGRGRERCR